LIDYFPLITSIISATFTVLVGMQYLQRRKKHQLIWTIALFMFFFTSLLGFVSQPEIMEENIILYRLYYVLAAPMVALLGAGTLYLLTHKPFGKYFLVYIIIIFIPFAALVSTASIDPNEVAEGFEKIGGAAMPSYVRILSPLFTIPGSIFLIGGAFYSFWLDRTRNYNLLIALGGAFPFFGGLIQRFGDPTFLSIFHTIGTLLLFIGFVLSREYVRKRIELEKKTEK